MMPDNSWIKIENLEYVLNHFRPILYHPYDPMYKKHWQQVRKRCVEGTFVEQFGKYRFIPGHLGTYGVFFRFEQWTDEGERITNITPDIRDLEWHRAYYDLECYGFSGFSNDSKYTSDKMIFDVENYKSISISNERQLHLFTKDGKFKEYIPPRENLFMLHDSNDLGRPLYYNEANNHLELGCRGGGKSYFTAGRILWNVIFNSAKSFDPAKPIKSKASIEICSPGGGKGKELLEKVEYAMNALADIENKSLGVFQLEDGKIEPCPFYKIMTGDITSNNKENPWTNVYKQQVGQSDWEEAGFGDTVYNTNHSPNVSGAATKSAGGRRTEVNYEEIGGYHPDLLLDAWGNNEGLVSEAGHKKAPQKGIGTAGDMQNIRDAQKIMQNPRHYKCLEFKYEGYSEPHAFFLPVYMVDPQFKDKDGNTDVETAKKFHKDKIQAKIDAGEPSDVIYNYKMNNPIEIEDMWITEGGKIMPIEEAKKRRNELLKDNTYLSLAQPIETYWNSDSETGASYKVLSPSDCEPFYRFPFTGKKDLEGAILMYIHPNKLKINGRLPKDVVFGLVDPYVAEEWDKGESLGAIYFIVNPKYIHHGLPGNKIAAAYVGKPKAGTTRFSEIACQLYTLYGNGEGNIWYEANRKNDKFRSVFIKNNRLLGLCSRPQFVQGNHIYLKNTTQTGYIVGNNKPVLWTDLAEWFKQETTLTINGETITKRNIEWCDDLFLIEQVIEADTGINVDAVSAMQGISLAIGENEETSKLRTGKNSLVGMAKRTAALAKIKQKGYGSRSLI